MNKLTSFAALVALALAGSLPGMVWPDETLMSDLMPPAGQTPAPVGGIMQNWPPHPDQGGFVQGWPVQPNPGGVVQGWPAQPNPGGDVQNWSPQPNPGGHAPAWQQPPRWPAPQQGYGHFPPHFPQGGQFQAQPAAPATARENPLSAELKQTQEQLAAKDNELAEARGMLEELDGKLQESLATEERLSEKIKYNSREQTNLRVRVIELTKSLNTSNTTLEQQHQLIDNHQAHNQQLSAELASRNEQLATLQSELRAATQALAQARARADAANEALGNARMQIGTLRDALRMPGAEPVRMEPRLPSNPQVPVDEHDQQPVLITPAE